MVKPIEDRFWSKVDIRSDDECWHWKAGKYPSGHGVFRVDNNLTTFASRVAWMITYGKISGDLEVQHKCDNPSCCNPNHLKLGTTTDNMMDKVARNRQAKGERNGGGGKLVESDVLDIRNRYNSGDETMQQIADDYGISPSLVSKIINRKLWSYL